MSGLDGVVEYGGGIDMLARSACVSVVPGSKCLPFRFDEEASPEAKERRCEALRDLKDSGGV